MMKSISWKTNSKAVCLSLIVFILLGQATSSAAQSTVKNAPPASPDPLGQFNGLLGTWSCRGKAFATRTSPQRSYQSTIHVGRELGNAWLAFRVALTSDGNSSTTTVEAVDYWGIDPEHGTITAISLDSFGISSRARVLRPTLTRIVEHGRTYGETTERFFKTAYQLDGPRRLNIRWSVSRDGRRWRARTEDVCESL
jgi:hypothetical protein